MARPAGATFVPAPAPPLPPPDDGATAARVIEALAAGGGWMTSGEIRDLVPMDAERMRRIVEPLVRDGRVERQGQRRGTRYRLVRPS